MDNIASGLLIIIVVSIFIAIYFIPAFIANYREHHNKVPIIILNVFLGWSLLGWVAALVWATTSTITNQDRDRISK